MKRLILLLIFAVAFISCKQDANYTETADLIVTNAKVAVMDTKKRITGAIAVKDGKILATGSNK